MSCFALQYFAGLGAVGCNLFDVIQESFLEAINFHSDILFLLLKCISQILRKITRMKFFILMFVFWIVCLPEK